MQRLRLFSKFFRPCTFDGFRHVSILTGLTNHSPYLLPIHQPNTLATTTTVAASPYRAASADGNHGSTVSSNQLFCIDG